MKYLEPLAILAALVAGGSVVYKKIKEKKGTKVAGDFGDEGEWNFLDDTEVDYWDAYS